MSQERVDKGWQKQGLTKYSTPAIIGTLAHYGIAVDEAKVKDRVAKEFPLHIAEEWQKQWKGTGQFTPFPIAAADELWRRFADGRLPPSEFALSLVQLMQALEGMRE